MNSNNGAVGVLLCNLGTPDSPGVADVRRYLKEFLSARRVVDTPRVLWWPILNLVILNIRPRHSARAYEKIWTEQGSPLMVIGRQQAEALQCELGEEAYTVELAMRYGSPSIESGIRELKQQGVQNIVVLPLYPQFSHTTTSSTLDAVTQALSSDSSAP